MINFFWRYCMLQTIFYDHPFVQQFVSNLKIKNENNDNEKKKTCQTKIEISNTFSVKFHNENSKLNMLVLSN